MKRQTLVLIALFGLLLIAILPAQAASVEPTQVDGNADCTAVGSGAANSLKIEPVTNGDHAGSGGVIITLANVTRTAFDFQVTGGTVQDVIVKGSGANHYDYIEGGEGEGSPVSSDTNLQIPNGNKLNHVWFCYDVTAEITGTKVNDTNTNGVADPGEPGVGNWQIFLLSDTGEGFDIVDSTFTVASENPNENGTYSLPGPEESGSYVVCEAANGPTEANWQQSGPLGPANDVCPDSVFDGESSISLAPGGYAIDYISGTRVAGLDFFNFDGDDVPLECGQEVSVSGGEGATGTFTRLANAGCDDEVTKTAELAIEQGGGGELEPIFDVIVFIPMGAGTDDYNGTLTFTKEFDDDTLLELQYDPDNDEVSLFQPVPACENATFDGNGKVVTADIPGEDSWCFASVEAHPIGAGLWEVTWQVFGVGDPRYR